MADDPPHKYPAYKLGEYTVVGEIAEGTFGKVKSKPTWRLHAFLRSASVLPGNGQWPCIP